MFVVMPIANHQITRAYHVHVLFVGPIRHIVKTIACTKCMLNENINHIKGRIKIILSFLWVVICFLS